MSDLRTLKEVDTDKAWKRVRQRLHDDGLIGEKPGIARIHSSSWLSYAAAVLVLIAIGSLGYFMHDSRSSSLLTLQTDGTNGTFVQTLGDGSVVYMAGNTVINYPVVFRGNQRKISLSGEAFFDVISKSDQPFVIETSHALIEVLGTAFNLKSSDDDFELIVEEGSVRVTFRDLPGRSEVVGQWERLKGAGNIIEKSPVVDRTYLSWRMNRMQFRDEKIDNIVSVISKNYNIDIEFENDSYRENRLNVTFSDNTINTIARVLAFSQGLDYEIRADSSLIFLEKR
jgi:ferric-dicitrate binding protein FerR (iron transport regulator)